MLCTICPPSFLLSISSLLCPSNPSPLYKLDSDVFFDGLETCEDDQFLEESPSFCETEFVEEGKSEVKSCNFVTYALTEESDDEEDLDEGMPELMDVEASNEENNNELEEDMWSKEEEEWDESEEENWYEDKEDHNDEIKNDNHGHDGIFNGLLVFLLDNRYTKQHPSEDAINWEEDTLIFPSDFNGIDSDVQHTQFQVLTAYK